MLMFSARERNERLALRIVGLCFVGLAVYIGYESIGDLVHRKIPEFQSLRKKDMRDYRARRVIRAADKGISPPRCSAWAMKEML
jgi:hypothetical protein